MAPPKAIFERDRILIPRYPFAPGSCRKNLAIGAADVIEADPRQCTLRLANEIIYLPGWPHDELIAFCTSNQVPVRERYNIWADILEPYVDTSFSSTEVAERRNRLRAAQISTWTVVRLRCLYFLPIVIYQGIAGEWTGLHHYDLLDSLRALRLVGLYGVVYRHTMTVALDQYR